MAKKAKSAENEALEDAIRTAFCQRRDRHAAAMGKAFKTDIGDGEVADVEYWRTHHIPHWDGGVDSRGATRKRVWTRLAAEAKRSSLDPKIWAEALFSYTYLFDHPPMPPDLLNDKVLFRARHWDEFHSEDIYRLASAQLAGILRECWYRKQDTRISEADAIRTVVLDPRIDASAIIRYAIAYRFNQEDLMELLEPLAMIEYTSSREAYESAIGSLFPVKLKELAKGGVS
jgi:hypothetical protein